MIPIQRSRTLMLPTTDGVASPFGFERLAKVQSPNNNASNYFYGVGAIVPELNPNASILAHYNYNQEELSLGTSKLEVFQIDITLAKTNVYSNIDDLSNAVGKLENQVWEIETLGSVLTKDETFEDLIDLSQNLTGSVRLESHSTVFNGQFSQLSRVNLQVGLNSSIDSLRALDYHKSDSLLSHLEQKADSNHSDYIYRDSVLKNSSTPISLQAGTITLPSAEVVSAEVKILDTQRLNDSLMASFLTETLKTTAGTTFNKWVLLQEEVTVTNTTTFLDETANTVATPVKPHLMLDTTLPNTLTVPLKLEKLRVEAESELDGSFNDIRLADLVLDNDQSNNITGVKTFQSGQGLNISYMQYKGCGSEFVTFFIFTKTKISLSIIIFSVLCLSFPSYLLKCNFIPVYQETQNSMRISKMVLLLNFDQDLIEIFRFKGK